MHNKLTVGDLMKIAKDFAILGKINKIEQFAKIYEIKQTLKLSFFIFFTNSVLIALISLFVCTSIIDNKE